MKTAQLLHRLQELGYDPRMESCFSYDINKDRRYLSIHLFEEPRQDAIDLAAEYGARFKENTLWENKCGEMVPRKIYEIEYENLSDYEFTNE